MDYRDLTEASEVFTPLKAAPSFEIAQDQEEDEVLLKIPHGLTAKKENRRKSYHYDASKNRSTDAFNFSPMRVPLTAPRPNILNSHPIANGNNLEHTKRSLLFDLQSPRSGKENENTSMIGKSLSPIQLSALEMAATFSSPDLLSHKRRSSLIGSDDAESPAPKMQKTDTFFDIEDVEEENEELGANEDEENSSGNEELSRIEPFRVEKAELSSVIIPTQGDLIQVDHLRSDNPQTPNRSSISELNTTVTEPQSRTIKDSPSHLDVSEELDGDSFAIESPIAQNDNKTNLVLDLGRADDFELSVSPERHVHMASPNKKPFFTITQVHEIQSDFKNEVQKLEENLKTKSMSILDLNNQVNESKNRIFKLEDDIESLALQKKQLLKENELLKTEHDIFRSDIAAIEVTVKKQEDRMERSKFVIGKFKERVAELDLVIKQKIGEITDLRSEIESKSRAIDILTARVTDYEKQAQNLTASLHKETEKSTDALQKSQELKASVSELKAQVESMTAEREKLSGEIVMLQELLHESKNENVSLMEKFTIEKDEIKEAESRYEALNLEILALNTTIQILEHTIEQEKESAKKSINEVSAILHKAEKELNLKNAMVTGLQGAVSTLKENSNKQQEALSTHKLLLKDTQLKLDDSTELLTIRKAEVDELNIEMKSAQEEIVNLRVVVDQKNIQISELNDSLQQHTYALEEKELVIRKMDLEIQKQEGEHLAELEAFHAEMSNVQSILSSKSNELSKLKEEKEQLQRDHDMLKYEHQTMRDESGDYDTRISNLKAKLQEYKSSYHESDALAKRLEEERAELERETDKRLQQLAEDLYIQYSKKHEQKVQVLKKSYESKWQSKVVKMESENEKLRREIEGLNARLEKENKEKNEIIKLWDQYKEAESR